MISPRRTRLVRVPDLPAFRAAILALSRQRPDASADRPLVVVPTEGAARQLAKTIDAVTRDGLYARLHARLAAPPRLLTGYEREVIARAAARSASPAPVRAGLVSEIVRFYDQLRRHGRSIHRFETLLEEALSKDAEFDRGAERLLTQTRQLAATFREYERRCDALKACDEHGLRDRLTSEPSPSPVRSVVVTVGDWIAEPNGLFLADFDLLTRIDGLNELDVVATDGLLQSGFHQRIHEWLPGIEEMSAIDAGLASSSSFRPTLLVDRDRHDSPVFVVRDREEELASVARRLAASADRRSHLERTAVVFRRPLPYLYTAPEVFGGARLPYQAADSLPLAAEPFAAAIDLVLDVVESDFTRSSLVALLRCPHFRFDEPGAELRPDAIAALDRVLAEARFLGGIDRLLELDAEWHTQAGQAARIPLRAARTAAEALVPLVAEAPASAQMSVVLGFLARYRRAADSGDRLGRRLARAQSALVALLQSLAAAYAEHDDHPIAISDLAAAVRRAIEAQTFALEPLESGGAAIQLVDDQAARYGDFDDMSIVGLIEGEWPERPRRNIFYPSSVVAALGWPSEQDRRSAAEARFLDLLASAAQSVTVSTVMLDDEALVEPSTFAEEIPRAQLATSPLVPAPRTPGTAPGTDAAASVFREEALTADPVRLDMLDEDAREWAALRVSRTPDTDRSFHGQTESLADRTWSVSALETYLGCPFQFFARHVLRLEEEAEDEEVMDPRRQGDLMHAVFEAFFARWQREGHKTITARNLDAARAMFREVVDDRLAGLSETEAALERTRLLGSAAAAGLGEAVFRMEAERQVDVADRLLEKRLDGIFTFETENGPRVVSLKGKVDWVDLLSDGTFRVVDYKLGWPPNRTRALQLPIYALAAERTLDGHLGRSWSVSEAVYLAFKGPKRVVPLFATPEERQAALSSAQERVVAAIDDIGAGRFPPTPDDVFRCETCSYSTVCRKDYVGDV